MSGMSGIEMRDQLVKLGYALPTVFITAFPTAALEAKVHEPGVLAVLTKPVDADAVAHWLDLVRGTP
jgi:FixJ family two-component response regulator